MKNRVALFLTAIAFVAFTVMPVPAQAVSVGVSVDISNNTNQTVTVEVSGSASSRFTLTPKMGKNLHFDATAYFARVKDFRYYVKFTDSAGNVSTVEVLTVTTWSLGPDSLRCESGLQEENIPGTHIINYSGGTGVEATCRTTITLADD